MTDIDTTPSDPADELPPDALRRSRFLDPSVLGMAALLFLALWLWRETMVRVAREHAQSQEAEINRLRTENELLTQQLNKTAGELSTLASAHVRTISLSGQASAPGASAKVFLDPKEGRANAFFYNLPRTNRGASYHLWFTGPDNSAVDGGAFTVGRSGRASLAVTNVPGDVHEIFVTAGEATAPRFLAGEPQ
jgi:hypothetical protein